MQATPFVEPVWQLASPGRACKLGQQVAPGRGLFASAMAGDMELMKKLRHLKSGQGDMEEHPETVDWVTGEREVAAQLAEVYHNLYLCAGSAQGMDELLDEI